MSELSGADWRWLDSAARLARPFLGTTAGEPTVGALIVDESAQTVLGRAVTAKARPPAELVAIAEARSSARGKTLYVTLEPALRSAQGPSCVDAIVSAGLARVVVGMKDPERRLAGEGMGRLRMAGIDVVVADHEASRELHRGQITRVQHDRPFVVAKLAVSKDGMIGRADQGNVPIAGEEARRFVDMQRALSDAVMIGARAATIDDPQLTVKLDGFEARTHFRIIVCGQGALDPRLDMIGWVSACATLVVADPGRALDLPAAVKVIGVEGRNGRPDLKKAMTVLAGMGVSRLLVEGGARLIESLLAADLIDRFHLIESDVVVGRGGVAATPLGRLDGRLRAAGLIEIGRRLLDADRLVSYERGA